MLIKNNHVYLRNDTDYFTRNRNICFFILAFIFINTGTLIKDANKKLHYIIYLTMFLTLILSLVLLGLQYYVPIIALFSGWWVYKLFH